MGQRGNREIRRYLEISGNGNATRYPLQDAAKAVLRGRFTAINAHLHQETISNSLTLYPKELEKEQSLKLRGSGCCIIKIVNNKVL